MQTSAPRSQAYQRDRSGALWLIQSFSGLLLILVLGLHMIAQHFVVQGGLRNFQQVIAYVSNPLIFAIEVLFLVVVTIHAMLGLRAILMDLGPGERGKRAINWGTLVIGIVALGYGIWLAVTLQSMG